MADVADILGMGIAKVEAARDSLVRKAAVALGYVTEKEAGIVVTMREDEVTVRRREVKKLWGQGCNITTIARELGMARKTVRRDLKAMGERQ